MSSVIHKINQAQQQRSQARVTTLAQEVVRLRELSHLLLTKLGAVTDETAMGVPATELKQYPRNSRLNTRYDPQTDKFLFWADLVPEDEPKPEIIAPRRIVLPHAN